jgi:RIO kinase 2
MKVAELLPELDKEDFKVLKAIEFGMKKSKYVKISDIRFYSRYKMEETQYRLDRIHKFGLTMRNAARTQMAYKLNSSGYDILALKNLVKKGTISQLGPAIGKGKESDVYSCIDDEENIYALKVYRIGRVSFKNVKLYRSLIGDRAHFNWLHVNRLAAKKEYENLETLSQYEVKTPMPVAQNRHMIVMEYLRGKELAYFKDINYPLYIFEEIIDQMKFIYQKARLIHADMGEFNVVCDEEGNILLIDWLQAVSADHPNAQMFLKRDVNNVCNFFRRKYKLECNTDEIIDEFLEN